MNKRILPLLAAACLLLSACGGAPQATATPTPAVTPTPEAPAVTAPPLSEPSGVYTDWSGLTAYQPPETVYTRAADGPMDTVCTGENYGMLLPYGGEALYVDSWQAGNKWGLVTADGHIVLDAVCTGAYRLSTYDYNSFQYNRLDFYCLEKAVLDPSAPDAAYNDGYTTKSALCALDGSWCTDFQFVSIQACGELAACVLDAKANLVLFYDTDGNLVGDTRDWPIREQLAEYAVYMLSSYAEGWAPLSLAGGGSAFVSLTGEMLDTPYGPVFEQLGSSGFTYGRAAAKADGLWGYLDAEGNWAVEPRYLEANWFQYDRAVVSEGGSGSLVIDPDGTVLHRFESSVYLEGDGLGGHHYLELGGTGACYDENFQPVQIHGQTPSMYYLLGYVLPGADGVTVLQNGTERFFAGAESVSGQAGLYLVTGQDGILRVLDEAQTVLLERDPSRWSLYIVQDIVTDTPYIAAVPYGGGSGTLYAADGTQLVTGYQGSASPTNGLFPCADSVSSGYKNADNQWVFRIRIDAGD